MYICGHKETRHLWQQCCPRISYRPAPAGNLWYSSLTSSCFAFPLSTLCLRISAISTHHSSNLELSRSTSSWRKAIQNRKYRKIFILFSKDQELCWTLNYNTGWVPSNLQVEVKLKTAPNNTRGILDLVLRISQLETSMAQKHHSKQMVPQSSAQH